MTTPLTAGCSALVLCVGATIASEALTTIGRAASANVALGGIATPHPSGGTPQAVRDGDLGTVWTGSGAFPQQIKVDWSTVRAIERVAVHFPSWLGPRHFRLQYWDAAWGWIDVAAEFVNHESTTQTVTLAMPVSTVAVRVTSSWAAAGALSVAELEAFEGGGASPAPPPPSAPATACDVTSGTAHNSRWSILAGWAIRDERWAYPYAEGQTYRFVGGEVYLDHHGSWQRWNEGLQRWEPTTPPSCGAPPPSCDVTSGTAHNSSWGILAGWAIRDERWAYPYAEGQSYRFMNGAVYLNNQGTWQRWNEGLQRWEGSAEPACSGTDTAPLTEADAGLNVKFAYWNLYGGTGKHSLTGACFDRFGNPVTEPAGAPGSTYPTWWAGSGPGRPAYEAFMADIAEDPEVVAVGVGESWGAGATLFPHLGWQGQSDGRPQKTPETSDGDQILARYGFVDREDYLLGRITLADAHTTLTLQYWVNYANVCVDRQCGRRMPFFSTHYQALQHPTDAWGQFDPAGTYEAGIERLLAYMDLKAGVGTPRVLVGDLNAWDPQTDLHVCTAASEPGPSHVAGIRRLRDGAGYTDAWRMIHPWGRADTGSLNRSDTHYQNCLIANGLAPGAPYKRIDYVFTKGIHAITSAEYVGAPLGAGGKGTVAWGNCAGSDHVGVKVGIHVP